VCYNDSTQRSKGDNMDYLIIVNNTKYIVNDIGYANVFNQDKNAWVTDLQEFRRVLRAAKKLGIDVK